MNKILILFFSIFTVLIMYFAGVASVHFSERVYVTSIIIQIISIWYIFDDKTKPYSLKKIFYSFSLFFFGIAPLLQMYDQVSLFGARFLKESEYFYINILIIIIIAIYDVSYRYFYKKKLSNKRSLFIKKFKIEKKIDILQTFLLILLALLSFYMIFIANNSNIYSMLFRDGEFKESQELSTTSSLIIFRVFQPLSMMILMYYIVSKSKNLFVYILLGIVAFITCFPLAMPRFASAAIYIPLLLLTIPWLRKENVFSLIFILGLLIIFPFLNNFRFYNIDNKITLGFDFDMFTQGHFDSYQNFALIVSENIITYGRQLLGVLFFWIPRSFWPNKPIGSGAYTANEEGFYFDNVSCNYFAEGYINFGFFGIMFFVILLSYISSRFDKYYWEVIVKENNNYFHVIYLVLIGVLFFILRGDLMSSFAYTVGFFVSIWIVYKAAGFRFK